MLRVQFLNSLEAELIPGSLKQGALDHITFQDMRQIDIFEIF